MFLSKRSNGIYYLWFDNELGCRQKVSTCCTRKSEALKFLQSFREREHQRRATLQKTALSNFTEDYLTYCKSVLAPKSVESASTSLDEFMKVVGDLPLHKVGVREIESFLAAKKASSSESTARRGLPGSASCGQF
jgi:hypothetical protein